MNCSHYNQLVALLQGILIQLNRTSIDLANLTCPRKLPNGHASKDAYLYILLVMAFYAFLTAGLILVSTRSHKAQEEDQGQRGVVWSHN
ncbi:potassium voltage-gated channel subfamily E regulatory beta subunit 5-like [Cetorhinus maximus]